MSTPRDNYTKPIYGAILEIISGMSSLRMYPSPIPGEEGFLADTDDNVKHAIEHFQQAIKLLDNI